MSQANIYAWFPECDQARREHLQSHPCLYIVVFCACEGSRQGKRKTYSEPYSYSHIYIYIYNYFYIYTVHTYFVIFLSFLTPLFAQVLRDGKEVQVPVPTVVAGDIAACLESVILLVCWFF